MRNKINEIIATKFPVIIPILRYLDDLTSNNDEKFDLISATIAVLVERESHQNNIESEINKYREKYYRLIQESLNEDTNNEDN